MTDTKLCSKCSTRKLRCEFYKQKRARDGRQAYCIACKRKADSEYNKGYEQRPERILKKRQFELTKKRMLYKQKWQAMRDKHLQIATPPWANKQAIEDIYKRADQLTLETGVVHEVHHIYPLFQFRHIFMGLHVESNLTILTQHEHTEEHKKLRKKYTGN